MKEKGCSFYMAIYTVEKKIEIIKHYEKYGFNDTLRVYNISNTALIKWRRQMESGDFMRKDTKTYSLEEKLAIIAYYRENGAVDTEEKYDISRSVFHKWERILVEYGEEELMYDGRGRKRGSKKDITKNEDIMDELHRLRIENMYLKKLRALVKERNEQENKKK